MRWRAGGRGGEREIGRGGEFHPNPVKVTSVVSLVGELTEMLPVFLSVSRKQSLQCAKTSLIYFCKQQCNKPKKAKKENFKKINIHLLSRWIRPPCPSLLLTIQKDDVNESFICCGCIYRQYHDSSFKTPSMLIMWLSLKSHLTHVPY